MRYLGVQDRLQIQLRSIEEFIDKENAVISIHLFDLRSVNAACNLLGILNSPEVKVMVTSNCSSLTDCRSRPWFRYCSKLLDSSILRTRFLFLK
jgi:hypothetical protein